MGRPIGAQGGAAAASRALVLIPVITTILGATLGYIVSRMMAGVSRDQANEGRLLDARLASYDSLRLPINDIYCYAMYVGRWKDKCPWDIIASKRRADELAYSYMPIWGENFSSRYRDFMHAAFAFTKQGGGDVKIMGTREAAALHFRGYFISHPRSARSCALMSDSTLLNELWANYFTSDTSAHDNRREVYMRYQGLMQEISEELGGRVRYRPGTPDYLPSDSMLQEEGRLATQRLAIVKRLRLLEPEEAVGRVGVGP